MSQTQNPAKTDPSDLRGVVAVDRLGRLGLITHNQDRRSMGTATGGYLWRSNNPVLLGRLSDWLQSGQTFPQWTKSRGYHGEVPEHAERRFLIRAQSMGVV